MGRFIEIEGWDSVPLHSVGELNGGRRATMWVSPYQPPPVKQLRW